MTRTILLATSTLALILVCFAIYHLSAGRVDTKPVEYTAEEHREFLTADPKQTNPAGLSVRGVEVSPGKEVRFTKFSPTGEPQIRWWSQTWEPRGENVIHMVTPKVDFLMPGGRKAYIQADEAEVTLQRGGDSSNYDARSGWLKGNVWITIDRTDQKWRNEHPDKADPEQHPEDIVKIYLDDMKFDLELALLESAGNVRVETFEAVIEGKGLVLRWNEVDNRIEQLLIFEGKRMELRRGGGAVQFAMPGSEEVEVIKEPAELQPPQHAMVGGAVPASRPAGQAVAAEVTLPSPNRPMVLAEAHPPAESQPASTASQPGKKMEPTIVLNEKDRKKAQIDTYQAAFIGDIHVEQRQGVAVAGELFCDFLELVFDFGSSQRQALAAKPGLTTQPSEQKQKEGSKQEEQPQSPADGTRLAITWTGRFELRPKEKPVQDRYTGQRFEVLAKGNPVRIKDKQGIATCAQLAYHNQVQKVWLRGDAKIPVDVQTGESRRLHANQEIFFDQQSGVAHVLGPGDLKDTTGGVSGLRVPGDKKAAAPELDDDQKNPVEIAWTRKVDLVFRQELLTETRAETGAVVQKRRAYLQSASLDGDARIAQGEQVAAGQQILLNFGKPRSATGFGDNLASMELRDKVSLTDARNHISCDRLHVDMTIDSAGQNVPELANAQGRVVARQGERRIECGESMVVHFASVPKPVPTVTLEQARTIARARGLNPTDEQLKQYLEKRARTPRTETRVAAMDCYGGVTVVDPEEALDIRCNQLECTLKDNRTINHALVIGTEDRWAYVGGDDFVLEGARVDINLPVQTTDVPGKGRLRFWSRQDLDGTQRDKPVAVQVEWSGKMVARGVDNYCEFTDDVVARSDTSMMRAGSLRLDFFDSPPPQTQPAGAFQKIASLWGSSKPDRSADRLRFSKKPRFLTADKNAEVISSTFETPSRPAVALADFVERVGRSARNVASSIAGRKEHLGAPALSDPARIGRLVSRMRIAGPNLLVDFRKEAVNVDGAGNLLIEDYRIPSPADLQKRGRDASSSSVVLGSFTGSDPSQTLITWLNSMSFLSDRNLAVFDRGVHLVHRSGKEMVLQDDLRKVFQVDEQALRQMKGRRADLSCDNLLVEFLRLRDAKPEGKGIREQVAATELNQFQASGSCHMREGTKSIIGERVVYTRDSNIVTVEGSEELTARIFDEDQSKGSSQHWHGARLRWYRDVNRIEVYDGTIVSRGR